MSGTASTISTRNATYGASFPRPGGRPILRGASVPRSAICAAIRTAVLGLTPKCRAAARREPPRTM